MDYNYDSIDFVDEPVDLGFENGLDLYCTYTMNQIRAGLGHIEVGRRNAPHTSGVLYMKDRSTDVFLVTLNKDSKEFSPTTMYEDYPISEDLFHWQSQNKATPLSGDGLRYVDQKESKSNVLIFVREQKKSYAGVAPYMYLGKADFVSSTGEKPMNIVWRMRKPIPKIVMDWSPATRR